MVLKYSTASYICGMNAHFARYNPWWDEGYTFDNLHYRPKWENILWRELETKQVTLLTGLRRSGKSSLMKLVISRMIAEGTDRQKIFYISLDDFYLREMSILEIVDEFRKLQGLRFSDKIWLFLDEVTYKNDYELQLKNLYDSHPVKVFATSSNSSLLNSTRTHLTGRHTIYELLTLDFDEYLSFKNLNFTAADEHLKENAFVNYLETGGLPEYVLNERPEYISNLVNDIIQKDIAAQHGVTDIKLLQDFFLLLMERSGKQLSLNKLARILSISPSTAQRYFNMFTSTFLIYSVSKFGKTNQRLLSPKKVYAADTGIRTFYTGARDYGSLFENYVYLRVRHLAPQYIKENGIEIDFFTKEKTLIEAKFHNEPLSLPQQQLFDDFMADEKLVIRSYRDLEMDVR